MKKEKICAILYYTAAVFFYLAAAINIFGGNDTSMGVVWLCLGSTFLCLGSVWLNKTKKKDEEKQKYGGLGMSRKLVAFFSASGVTAKVAET